MNFFLTERSARKPDPLLVVFVGCLVLFGAVSVFFGVIGFLNRDLKGGMTAAVIGAVLLIPAGILVFKEKRRLKAVRIAAALQKTRCGRVSFEKLSKAADIREPGETVLNFIRTGYLRNIQVDFENEIFLLSAPKPRMIWSSPKKTPRNGGSA